jgi:Ca-activated chloride channel family protein
MSFAKINFLFVIWVLPFLLAFLIYGSRRRQHILNAFCKPKGLSTLVPKRSSLRRWIKATLILLAVLLIVVSLAGPQYGYIWQEVEQKGVDLIIALDCSRSMLAQDIQPNRLERAKREIYDLLALLKGDRVGLVAFAGTAFLQCPLTLDSDAFFLFLNVLTPDYLPVGGTDLNAAVTRAMSTFNPTSNTEKAIILITDGEHTGVKDPIKAAQNAAAAGIKLFCVGVGETQGVPLKKNTGEFTKDSTGRIVFSKLDETTLKEMAKEGHGIYVPSVAGDMDLDAIYTKEIKGKMTATTLSGGRRKVHQNRYQWPLFIAIVLLLIERSISVVRRASPISLFFFAFMLMLPTPGQADDIKAGMTAYKNKNFSKAIDHFTSAQLDDPDRPEILYNLGSAYYKNKEYDAAKAHMHEALTRATPSLKAKIHYDLGNIDFREGRLEDAVKNYEKALELAPDDNQAKENIEFVKKVMQQKPPPSKEKENQKGKEDSSQKKKQAQNQSTQQGGTPLNQKEKTSPTPSNNSKEPQKKDDALPPSSKKLDSDTKEQSTPPSKERPGSKNTDQNSSQNMSQFGEADDQDKKRAEQLLKRLKDQPGRATMPSYGKMPVEKNW